MHAVLHLQPDGLDPQRDQTLEHALTETRPRGSLGRHNRPELAVIADHDHLLGAHDERDEAFRFRRLRALVHEHLAEAKVRQPRVPRADGGYANHVRGGDDLALNLTLQTLMPPLVVAAELAEFILELLQLLKLRLSGESR